MTHTQNIIQDTKNLLFRFTEHLEVLNRSPVTIKDYSGHVRLFLAWLDRDIRAVARADMEHYIAGLHDHRKADGRGYSTNTIIIKIRSLKRFFEFLELGKSGKERPPYTLYKPETAAHKQTSHLKA